MNVRDLTWPNPGDPDKIAQWFDEGSRGLLVTRANSKVYDWDMDMAGETFPLYIAHIAVPKKLAGLPGFREATAVTFYRVVGRDLSIVEFISVPFLAPPIPGRGTLPRVIMSPAQDLADSMIAEVQKLREQLLAQRPGLSLPF